MAGPLFGQRVSADGVNQTPLSPAAAPVNTYVRPMQQPDAGRNAMAIADALGGMNKALLAYGSMAASQRQDPNSTENENFKNSLYGKSIDELKAMSGKHLSHVQESALGVVLGGGQVADDFQKQATEYYANGFDHAKGSWEQELSAMRLKVQQGLPSDAAKAAFWKATDGFVQRSAVSDLQGKVDAAAEQRNDGVFKLYRGITTEGLHKGWSNAKIVADIMSSGKTLKDFNTLDGPAQNEILYQFAKEQAELGRPDLVKQLLTTPRADAPALIGTAKYSVTGNELIKAAQQTKDAADSKGQLGIKMKVNAEVLDGTFTDQRGLTLQQAYPWMSDEYIAANVDQAARVRAAKLKEREADEAIRLRRVASEHARNDVLAAAVATTSRLGGFQKLHDVEIVNASGTGTTTVTAKEQQDLSVDTSLANIEAQRQQNLKTLSADPRVAPIATQKADEVAFQQKLMWFAGNGAINPEWDAVLNNTHLIASPSFLADGKPQEVTPEIADAARLYVKLYAANPAYAAKLLGGNKDAETFFEAYRFAHEDGGTTANATGGLNDKQALLHAAQVVALPESAKRALDVSDKVIDDQLNSTSFRAHWYSGGSGWEPNEVDNGRMRELVHGYLAMSMPMQKALTKAVERMQATHVVINGYSVPSNDRTFPQDFKPIIEQILGDYVKDHGAAEGIVDPSELTVQPIGGNHKWGIIQKDVGPVMSGTYIDLDRINAVRKANEERRLLDIHEAATQHRADAKVSADRNLALRNPGGKRFPAGAPKPFAGPPTPSTLDPVSGKVSPLGIKDFLMQGPAN